MASSQLGFPRLPEDRQDVRFDGRHTAELERVVRFGLRRRELEGILPSGSITIDAAMGVGGLPRGRVIELYGPPAIGKTTLGLQAVAAVQREGETAAFVDVERAFDGAYAARVGVDVEALLLARAEDGQQAFRIIEKLAASKAVDLIIVDSAAALLPPEEREERLGEAGPFGQCEMLASGLRRLVRALQGSPACVLFLNQVRAYKGFGYAQTSAGGWALKMHAAVRADLEERAELRNGKRVGLRIVKNQLAKPKQLEFDLVPGTGVDPAAELIDRGIECGVVKATRAGIEFDGQVVGRSREDALERLSLHATLAAQVRTEVRLALGLPQRRPAGREEQPADVAVRGANAM
ncbi:MAG: DNA recombination/repair protein RecA [Acidobacteria bacterium]|nr:DNA recombination/repair protein RecA [Acidobacteriota bacterium]